MAGDKQRNEGFVPSHETLYQCQLSREERAGNEWQQADEFTRQREGTGRDGLPDATRLNGPSPQDAVRRLAQQATGSSRNEADAEWEQDFGKLAGETFHVWHRAIRTLNNGAGAGGNKSTEFLQTGDH
jgi:hypothetical protein